MPHKSDDAIEAGRKLGEHIEQECRTRSTDDGQEIACKIGAQMALREIQGHNRLMTDEARKATGEKYIEQKRQHQRRH